MKTRTAVVAVLSCLLSIAQSSDSVADPSVSLERGWWWGSKILVPISNAPGPSSKSATENLERLSTRFGDRLDANWDESTGYPKSVRGRLGNSYSGSVSDIASAFVKHYKNIFTGVPAQTKADEHISFVPSEATHGAWGSSIVWLSPHYMDMPMYGGLSVKIGADMKSITVRNNFRYIEQTAFPNPLDPTSIEDRLRALLEPDSVVLVGSPHLLVYPSFPPRLAYQCTVTVNIKISENSWGRPLPNELVLDANTCEILRVQNYFVSESWEFPFPPSVEPSDSVPKDSQQHHQFDPAGTLPPLKVEPRPEGSMNRLPPGARDAWPGPRAGSQSALTVRQNFLQLG